MARWRDETPTDPTRRQAPTSLEDVYYRQGMMMRDLSELRGRLDRIERASMRPRVKTAGLASAVAGSVFGILELLRYVGFVGK